MKRLTRPRALSLVSERDNRHNNGAYDSVPSSPGLRLPCGVWLINDMVESITEPQTSPARELKEEKMNEEVRKILTEFKRRITTAHYDFHHYDALCEAEDQICQLFPKTEEPKKAVPIVDFCDGLEPPTTGGVSANPPEIKPYFQPCKQCGMLILANKQRCPNCSVVDPFNRGIGEPDRLLSDEDGLIDSDLRCDLLDAVMGLHPRLSLKLQNTMINLIIEVAKAQRDLTASGKDAKYRQAIQDSRDGKPLDLSEEEFEIFCSIENMYIDKVSKIKEAEYQQRIEGIRDKWAFDTAHGAAVFSLRLADWIKFLKDNGLGNKDWWELKKEMEVKDAN